MFSAIDGVVLYERGDPTGEATSSNGRCLGILPRTPRSWHEGISFVSTHHDCRMDACGTRRRWRRARELITQARARVRPSAASLVRCCHPDVKPGDLGLERRQAGPS